MRRRRSDLAGESLTLKDQRSEGISEPLVRLWSTTSPRVREPYRSSSKLMRSSEGEPGLKLAAVTAGGLLSLTQRNRLRASCLLFRRLMLVPAPLLLKKVL